MPSVVRGCLSREAAYLTPDQVRSLLLAAKPSRYAPLFELLVNTGLRRGEALALHWSDIDFDEKLLQVRGTLARVTGELVVSETKTPRSRRVVPLSPTSERLLRDVRANQRAERLRGGLNVAADAVRVHHRAGVSPVILATRCGRRALKTAAKRAGVPSSVGLHTLRHSAASVMLSAGVPLKVVSEVFGHASVAIT
jgi:integrase